MSGKVPLSRRSQSRVNDALDAAQRLYEDFTGMEPDSVEEVTLDIPDAGIIVGHVDGILYTTVRDHETESYIHEFKARSKPVLIASADGSTLLILGGHFEFTERGIVDH